MYTLRLFLIYCFVVQIIDPWDWAQGADPCAPKKIHLSEYSNFSQFKCEVEFAAHGCLELKQELESSSPELVQNLRNCQSGDEDSIQAEAMVDRCLQGAKKQVQSSMEAISEVVSEWVKDTTLCNEKRKRMIYEAYNQSVANKEDRLAIPESKQLLMIDCEVIRQQINQKLLLKTIQRETSISLKQRWVEAEYFLKQIEAKKECYRPEVKAELICSAMMALGGVIGSGGVINRSANLFKLSRLTGTQKVEVAIEALQKPGRVSLEAASNLDSSERIALARAALSRPINGEEQKAILKAHEVGQGKMGYFSYTPAELREKVRILKEAGLNAAEADRLMRLGIAGEMNVSSAIQKIAESAQENKSFAFLEGNSQSQKNEFIENVRRYEAALKSKDLVDRLNSYRLLSNMAEQVQEKGISLGFLEKYYQEFQKGLKSDPSILRRSNLSLDYARAAAAMGDDLATRAAMKSVIEYGYQGQKFSNPSHYAEQLATQWLKTSSPDPLDQLISARQRKAVIEEFFRDGGPSWARLLKNIDHEIFKLQTMVDR